MSRKDPAQEAAIQRYQDLSRQYETLAKENTGEAGYKKSLEMAKEGALTQARQAGNEVLSNARTSGMSKAQAAAMGANSVSNAYGNSFTTQQNIAQGQNDNQLNAAQNVANNQLGVYNALQTNEQANKKRGWGLAGDILSFGATGITGAASDERLKNYYKITGKFSKQDYKKLCDFKGGNKCGEQ